VQLITENLLPTHLKKAANLSREGDPKVPNTLTSGNLPLVFDHPTESLENARSEFAARKALPVPGNRQERNVMLGHGSDSSTSRLGSGSSGGFDMQFFDRT
jgi:hypothetical protein